MAFFNLVRQPDRVERLAEVIDKLVRWGGREGGEGEGERREGGGMGKDIEGQEAGRSEALVGWGGRGREAPGVRMRKGHCRLRRQCVREHGGRLLG